MATATAIKEGLICGECHAEFTSVEVLLSHYEKTHSQETETNSIKGLIDKAKSRLVNKQEEVIRTTPAYYDIYEEDVVVGQSKSHFKFFKQIRAFQVERLSSEASKLLIRLHKIISFEGEENKRRAFEQNIVQWMEEKHVSRCPDCAEAFNILQRKHHCRLCGSILCDICSMFISGELAVSLTSKIGKHETLQNEYRLRTCAYCYNLVKLKGSTVDTNPPVVQNYEKLKELMTQCKTLNLEYSTMISSVDRGDNLYSMEQVSLLRNDLIKHTEKIDLLSKGIVLLEVEKNEPMNASEIKLRSRLRSSTINWIRDFLSGLTPIPEKEKAQDVADGWTPSIDNNPVNSESDKDVVAVQIGRLRKWIAEAKKANRIDEVEMLQANLTDLLRFKNSG